MRAYTRKKHEKKRQQIIAILAASCCHDCSKRLPICVLRIIDDIVLCKNCRLTRDHKARYGDAPTIPTPSP